MTVMTKVPVKQTPVAQRPSFNIFGSLQREIDNLFEEFAPALANGRGGADMKCRMNLAETKTGLELTVELPGLEEKDVEVSVADGVLTVSGEKSFEKDSKDQTYHFIERGYGEFSRSIALPDGVKADSIKASMAKGVLTVTIPTPARSEPTKISVKSAT